MMFVYVCLSSILYLIFKCNIREEPNQLLFFIFILYEDAIEKEKSMHLLSYIIY